MLIQKEPIFNRIGQPIYPPVWTLAGETVAKTLHTQYGPVDAQIDVDVADLIEGRRVSWVHVGAANERLQVCMGRPWSRECGIKGSSIGLHRLPFIVKFNLLPPPVDHVNEITDNRIKSLRLVTQGINCANGSGCATSLPGVSYHLRTEKWRCRVSFHGKTISFGLYPTEVDAWNAAQPVLHYRSRTHAEWSAFVTGKFLAGCSSYENSYREVSGWPENSIGTTAFNYFLEFTDSTPFELVPPPVKQLRTLCRLAAAGNVSLAVAIATQMAGEDSLKSLDLYVNGFNADGSKRESVVDGGGAV